MWVRLWKTHLSYKNFHASILGAESSLLCLQQLLLTCNLKFIPTVSCIQTYVCLYRFACVRGGCDFWKFFAFKIPPALPENLTQRAPKQEQILWGCLGVGDGNVECLSSPKVVCLLPPVQMKWIICTEEDFGFKPLYTVMFCVFFLKCQWETGNLKFLNISFDRENSPAMFPEVHGAFQTALFHPTPIHPKCQPGPEVRLYDPNTGKLIRKGSRNSSQNLYIQPPAPPLTLPVHGEHSSFRYWEYIAQIHKWFLFCTIFGLFLYKFVKHFKCVFLLQ